MDTSREITIIDSNRSHFYQMNSIVRFLEMSSQSYLKPTTYCYDPNERHNQHYSGGGLRFTSRILRTNEDVSRLGQPLHELGDAFCIILSLTQRAHHGTQDPTDDFCEQFWVERFSCTGRMSCWVRSCSTTGAGWRWGCRKDGLGGLKGMDKEK